jgi:hypothetical protein
MARWRLALGSDAKGYDDAECVAFLTSKCNRSFSPQAPMPYITEAFLPLFPCRLRLPIAQHMVISTEAEAQG